MTERYSPITAASRHVHMLIESNKARAKSYWKASTPLQIDRGCAFGNLNAVDTLVAELHKLTLLAY